VRWQVRRVRRHGEIKWQGRLRHIGQAFAGEWIGLKSLRQGVHEVYLERQLLGTLHDEDLAGMRPASRRAAGPAAHQKL